MQEKICNLNSDSEKNMNSIVITTICYGDVRRWLSIEEAEKFFIECLINSEGAEYDRYLNVLSKIKAGQSICSDE